MFTSTAGRVRLTSDSAICIDSRLKSCDNVIIAAKAGKFTAYGRGGQITARGPDLAHRSISCGPLVPAETTAIL